MPFPRSSGILLHPTSLPGDYGIGDLGPAAYKFVDFLHHSAQQLWQVLPLGPTGYGNSPYMSFSALAGNPLLISPEVLCKEGFLAQEDLGRINFPSDRVDFDPVVDWKFPLLRRASQTFKQQASVEQQQAFEQFCQVKAHWLEDYALFMALLSANIGEIWTDWPEDIRNRQGEAVQHWRSQLQEEIFFHQFLQFEFFRQWTELKTYANDRHIQIVGDIPIYVAHNSADVWTHPEIFQLDPETGLAMEMAGVPPDYFSATGQLWGNPVYDWDYLESTGFSWWVERLRSMLDYVDLIRIDHFRGFEAYWSVPAGEETAIKGRWVKAPGYQLFESIRAELGSLPILAEDLGDIDAAVIELRDHFQFPGMKILQFAFGSDSHNTYLPFNLTANSVIYTGTHDNNTSQGWYEQISDYERDRLHKYLGCRSEDGIAWDMIRLALSSVANQAIIPLQDVLGLGAEARMNTPGIAQNNWAWRYQQAQLTEFHSQKLKEMTQIYGRQATK